MATTQLPKNLRNWTVYIDGIGYAGRAREGTPPKIALKTFEYQGGGMVGAVDLPSGSVQKMTWDVTLEEYAPDVIGLFGKEDVKVTFRGAQGSTAEAIIIETHGLLHESDMGGWKGGDEATLKISGSATYYKLTVAGSTIIEIDVENMILKRGATDLLANIRTALGM